MVKANKEEGTLYFPNIGQETAHCMDLLWAVILISFFLISNIIFLICEYLKTISKKWTIFSSRGCDSEVC